MSQNSGWTVFIESCTKLSFSCYFPLCRPRVTLNCYEYKMLLNCLWSNTTVKLLFTCRISVALEYKWKVKGRGLLCWPVQWRMGDLQIPRALAFQYAQHMALRWYWLRAARVNTDSTSPLITLFTAIPNLFVIRLDPLVVGQLTLAC
jgi:hypothetical protein